MSNCYNNKNINELKLYNYTKDSNRKIVEEENTIYEVDNQCIVKNRTNNKTVKNKKNYFSP